MAGAPVIEWGPPRSIKGKECHRSSRRKTFATINPAFIPPPPPSFSRFVRLYARSNLIAVVCKWPLVSLISSQGAPIIPASFRRRRRRKNKTILIGSFFQKIFDVQNIVKQVEEGNTRRSYTYFNIHFEPNLDAAVFLSERKKGYNIEIWIWHIPPSIIEGGYTTNESTSQH